MSKLLRYKNESGQDWATVQVQASLNPKQTIKRSTKEQNNVNIAKSHIYNHNLLIR